MADEVKRPVGRPRIYSPDELAEKLNDFIDNEDDPLLEKFTLPRDMPSDTYIFDMAKRESLVGNNALSEAIKRAYRKQRIYLLSGQSKEMVKDIFRLKQPQHGFVDKVVSSVEGEVIVRWADGTESKESG